MLDDAPAGRFVRARRGTVDSFKSKHFVNPAGEADREGDEVGGRERVVVPGVRLGVGAGLGDYLFDIKKLRIIVEKPIEGIKVFFKIIDIFGITMPGDKVETEIITSGSRENGFDPVGIEGGSGRTAEFVVAT